MNKIFIVLLFISLDTFACDICGCGNSSSFFGILPQSHLRYYGVRYRFQGFTTHASSPTMATKEQFSTIEPWLRLYPLRKTQLIVMMPYHFNTQTIQQSGQKLKLNGLGDISMLAHYNLKNTMFDSTHHKIDQIWLLGGGLKLPTGKYQYEISDKTVANPNFQTGTGSVDFLISSIYTVRKKNLGANLDLTYKINTKNKDNYRFGNKSRASLSVFNQFKIGGWTLMPNAGLISEFYEKDHKEGKINALSGGYLHSASFGSEFYVKKLTFGINYQMPIAQNLSTGELKFNQNLSGHITLLF